MGKGAPCSDLWLALSCRRGAGSQWNAARIGKAAMATKIYVNLPVKDLQRSARFFKAIGFGFNPQLSDETAACMMISDDIFAMLLTEAKFREIARRPVADTTKLTEVLTCLS